MYGVRQWSSFILLHVAAFPTPFIEETVLSLFYILGSIVINLLTIYVWVYFWALYSVPLVSVSGLMPIPFCFN